MEKANTQAINAVDAADLIAESEVKESLDIGHSIVYILRHPRKGAVVLMNSALGSSAIVSLTQLAEALTAAPL